MESILYQDWITLQAPLSGAVAFFVQSESAWHRIAGASDLAVWVEVAQVTGPTPTTNLYLDLQTAMTKDESSFASIIGPMGTATSGSALVAGGSTALRFLRDGGAYTPMAEWLRWVVTANGVSPTQVWTVTFRIWLVANYDT